MRISDWSSDVCSSDLKTWLRVSPLATFTSCQLFRSTCAACLADAGSGGSSRDSVVSGVAAEACAALEDMALEKPGTMAMTSVPSIANRSEEHTSELQSLMRISYAVFCLKKKTQIKQTP